MLVVGAQLGPALGARAATPGCCCGGAVATCLFRPTPPWQVAAGAVGVAGVAAEGAGHHHTPPPARL